MKCVEERAVLSNRGTIEEINYIGELRCAVRNVINKNSRCFSFRPIITGEGGKEIFLLKPWEDSASHLGFKRGSYRPDLVIHENNKKADLDERKQLLIIEAKTSKYISDYNFCRDFFKLNVYIEYLSFQKAIYLILGNTAEYVDKKIKNYIENYKYQVTGYSDKLYFVIQEKLNGDVELYQFNNDCYK